MEYKRILIVKPSSLGDIIHAIPVLHLLRRRFPQADLAWFIHEKWADIIRGHPDLNELIAWSFRWSQLPGLFKIFRERRFDLAVDLQGLFRSGVISYLSGAPVRVGFKNGREGSPLFYTHKISVPQHPIHAIDRYLLAAQFLGAVPSDAVCTIPISSVDERFVDHLLHGSGLSPAQHFVALSPTARWRTKRWPIDRFSRLTDLVQESGTTVVIIGGEGDIPEIRRMQSSMKTHPVVVAGKTTLKQLAALLKRARLLVTNDSGPMHLAVAVGTPVVALFGPTDPIRTGPYRGIAGQLHTTHTIIRRSVECSPCLSRYCKVNDHRCMMQIGVEEVLEQIKKVLTC
jgi:lipopolysaccharide heptosyltransferase I